MVDPKWMANILFRKIIENPPGYIFACALSLRQYTAVQSSIPCEKLYKVGQDLTQKLRPVPSNLFKGLCMDM